MVPEALVVGAFKSVGAEEDELCFAVEASGDPGFCEATCRRWVPSNTRGGGHHFLAESLPTLSIACRPIDRQKKIASVMSLSDLRLEPRGCLIPHDS